VACRGSSGQYRKPALDSSRHGGIFAEIVCLRDGRWKNRGRSELTHAYFAAASLISYKADGSDFLFHRRSGSRVKSIRSHSRSRSRGRSSKASSHTPFDSGGCPARVSQAGQLHRRLLLGAREIFEGFRTGSTGQLERAICVPAPCLWPGCGAEDGPRGCRPRCNVRSATHRRRWCGRPSHTQAQSRRG
jgi:hypothetical protein